MQNYAGYEDVQEAYQAHKDDVNADSHLWLYAKHHYIRRNRWEDLRLLLGVRCLIDPECVSKSDVLVVLGGLVHPILMRNEHVLSEFFKRLDPTCFSRYSLDLRYNPLKPTDEPYEDRLLAGYLCIMGNERIRKNGEVLIELDEADPKLLPTVSVCPKGGEHKKGTDGVHSNVYCKKCFQTMESVQ